MTRPTKRELLVGSVKLPKAPEVPHAEEYVPLGTPVSAGHPFIEVIGRIVLDSPTFRQRCIDLLPAPFEPTRSATNPIVVALNMMPLIQAVYPTPNLCRLYPRILELIVCGYVYRNPFNARETARIIHFLSTTPPAQLRIIVEAKKDGPPLSLMIMGASGMGKTFGTKYALGFVPQARRHTTYNERRVDAVQVLWLYVECPPTGTLKALLLNILLELDKVVGTTYYFDWLLSGHSTDVLLINVALILYNHNLGLLVLDELQHLGARGFAESDANLNFFVSLMNFICIPIVSIGTYAALAVLTGRLRDSRRLSACGTVDFARYERTDAITGALHNYYLEFLPGKDKRPVTEEFHDRVWDIHQGLHFIIPNLVQRCAVECSYRGEDHVSDAILDHYKYEELKPLRRALDALASNDPDQIALFDDLMAAEAIRALAEHQSKVDEQRQSHPASRRSVKARGALGRIDPEFPHDQITADQISKQCAMTKMVLGDGDLYPALKRAGLVATELPYGVLSGAAAS